MSAHYKQMQSTSSSELMDFLVAANKQCPGMFSDDVDSTAAGNLRLLDDLRCVFVAHKRLLRITSSEGAVSEASMVANVYVGFQKVCHGPNVTNSYEVIRSSAAATSSYRSVKRYNTGMYIVSCTHATLERNALSPYHNLWSAIVSRKTIYAYYQQPQ